MIEIPNTERIDNQLLYIVIDLIFNSIFQVYYSLPRGTFVMIAVSSEFRVA
jgi:hypothetical protein